MCETLCGLSTHQANMRCWPNADLMLAHRLRRWPNIKTSTGSTPRVCWAAFKCTLVWQCILLAASTSWDRHNVCQLLGQQRRSQWRISPALGQCLAWAASTGTIKTAGSTDSMWQTYWADRGKPTCPHLCVQRGGHNKAKYSALFIYHDSSSVRSAL